VCDYTFLARKAKKHGYSVEHSSRSTIHFIAHFSISFKPLTNFQKIVLPTRFPRQELPPCRKKNGNFSVLFSVKGTDDSPTGTHPWNRVGDQEIGSPCTPVSSGLQVPGDPGNCRARTRHRDEIPNAIFLQNVLKLHQLK